MGKIYNILWIDDEHKDLADTLGLAAENQNIFLHGYTSYEEGFEELEKNLHFYDGILLDALFFADRASKVVNSKGLGRSIAKINELKSKKAFPFFVLSGQTEFTETENPLLAANEITCFKKGHKSDREALFIAIKTEADKLPETQIRHKYQEVFDVCIEKYIGTQAAEDLLAILQNEEAPDTAVNIEKYATPLRQIIEDIFRAFHKYGLLPDEFVTRGVALNESSQFLKGDVAKGFKLNFDSCLPSLIAGHLWSILQVVQPAAHRSEIDTHIRTSRTPYLLYSTTYLLCDFLVWFKRYIDSNPMKSQWITVAQSTGWREGKVESLKHNGLIFIDDSTGETEFIFHKNYDGQTFSEGDALAINAEPNKKDPSKLFIKQVKRL